MKKRVEKVYNREVMNKRYLLIFIFLLSTVLAFSLIFFFSPFRTTLLSPLGTPVAPLVEKPLMKYSFESLRNRTFDGGDITIGEVLKDGPGFTSYLYSFLSDGKKVSGLINVPKKEGTFPAVLLFRGYVDREIYEPGVGTSRVGEAFASAGFITLAPDFLGYGASSSPSAQPIEERFETYTTAGNLLASVKNLNVAFKQAQILSTTADTDHIGIWGHSNGGHIALSTLAITGKAYPTVLWAPVSKPFPYSILYYTDEYEDHGKTLRKVVADFEKDYDSELFSPSNYFTFIQAPLQIHQGGADEAVPLRWSDQFVSTLKGLDKEITYYTYPNENHNFTSGSWSLAVSRSISFYKNAFSKTQ